MNKRINAPVVELDTIAPSDGAGLGSSPSGRTIKRKQKRYFLEKALIFKAFFHVKVREFK